MVQDKAIEELSLVEILELAIEQEKDAFDYYTNAASVAVKPSAKKMFLSLAEREKDHVREICEMLTEVKAQLEIDRAMTGGGDMLS